MFSSLGCLGKVDEDDEGADDIGLHINLQSQYFKCYFKYFPIVKY
jgi:hypothetical protein